jgi:glycosyltransferase involved in cell wall biosynthesis
MFVLLLDSPEDYFDPQQESFTTVYITELGISDLQGLLFKYSVLEASTAVKPYLLSYLFRTYSIDKLIYLDPDIQIFNTLEPLLVALQECNVLLIPHLTTPLPRDLGNPSDYTILQAGTYNLGFIGLRDGEVARSLLNWWSDKLYHQCIISFERNLFVDQRWMDLVPGLFDRVRIWRDPGYDIAYWNLHERRVSVNGNSVTVNGRPVHFFHFSGFNPDKPSTISKHQDRFKTMADIGGARRLFARYRHAVIEKGWNESKNWEYTHNFFDSGDPIPEAARRYYWGLGPDVGHLGDPFTWLDDDSVPRERNGKLPRGVHRRAFGVNVLGYLTSEKGVGEGVRSNLRIVDAARVPYVANNTVDGGSYNLECLSASYSIDNPFAVNLMTVNADQFAPFAKSHPSYMRNRFNIGYWAWELPEFPPEWAESFQYADAIWTPSAFTRDSVATISPVTVRVLPHSIDTHLRFDVEVDRRRFGIADDIFTFLFFFDFHSFMERKNPLQLIQCFRNAFGNRRNVQLLIKSSHSAEHKPELRQLEEASLGANVRILDEVLSRDEKHALMMACDSYISLHRSEGFGLTMAEAMQCGKPVIATGYSGNVDFMTPETGFLVPYRLMTIDRTHGPYRAGYHWAQPDLEYATDVMRYVEKDRDAAAAMGKAGKEHVWTTLQPRNVAKTLLSHLTEIGFGHFLRPELSNDSQPSAPSSLVPPDNDATIEKRTDDTICS